MVAIPTYLSIADLGILTIATNRIIISKNEVEKNTIFQSAQLFVFLSCISILLIAIIIVYLEPFEILLNKEYKVTIIILIIYTLLSFINGLSQLLFKSTNRYSSGIYIDCISKVAEWAGGVVGLILTGSYISVAVGMLLVRLLSVLITSKLAVKNFEHLEWGINKASKKEIKEMLAPSFAITLIPLGTAVGLQGFTILTGAYLGGGVVVIFNTYRTLTRLIVQFSAAISFAIWPEFSRLYGNNEFNKLRKIYDKLSNISYILISILAILLYIASPTIINFWARDKISYNNYLLILFLTYSSLTSIGHLSRVFLMATNKHILYSYLYLLLNFISLFLAYVVVSKYSIYGLLYVLIGTELIIFIISTKLTKNVFSKNYNIV